MPELYGRQPASQSERRETVSSRLLQCSLAAGEQTQAKINIVCDRAGLVEIAMCRRGVASGRTDERAGERASERPLKRWLMTVMYTAMERQTAVTDYLNK